MIKNITFLIIILIGIKGISQNCKYVKNEIDEFTNQKIKMTPFDVLSYGAGQSEVVRVQGMKINDIKFLKCYFVMQSPFSVDEKSKFILLDDKKNTYELTFPKYISSDYDSNFKTFYISANFAITDDLHHDLRTKNFTKLRFYTNNGYVEHEIKPKHLKNLHYFLSCIN